MIYDFRTEEEINIEKDFWRKSTEDKMFMREDKDNPNKIEYWKRVFPNISIKDLEQYRIKWGKENPEYLKFPKLKK